MSEDEDYESNDDEEQPDPFRGYSPRYAPQSYYSSGALTASNSSAIVHNHRHSYAHETPSNPLPPRHINLDTYPSTPAAMAKYEAKRARLYPYSSTTLPRTSMDRGRGWPFNSVSLIEESNDNPFESSPTAVDDTSPSSYSSGGSEKWGLKRWSRISSISKPVHSNDYTDEFAVVNEKSAVQTIPEEAEVQRLIPQLRNVLHRKKEPLQRTYTDPVPEPVSEQEVRQDSSPKVLKKDRNDDEDDYVPTCTDAIRQQWYTMSLSLRLGLHRTKLKLILRGTGGGNR
ncbi:hypothetical protein FRC03_007962 [Tulasnella sp. 419]|nr:hypothetical protein FRC03_007962 [Tulasnella sp. 419]